MKGNIFLVLAVLLLPLAGVAAAPARAQEPDLSQLSPQQRRAVEKMQGQGVTLQQVGPAPAAAQPLAQTGSLLQTPDFLPVRTAEEIVAVNLLAPAGQAARFVTFGQAFRQGALAPGDQPGLRVGERVLPVQMDVKALHEDGSVRHAVLTADLGALPRGNRHQAMIVRAGPALQGAAPAIPASGTEIAVSGADAAGGKFAGTYPVDGAAPQRWLDGPLVREETTIRAVGPLLVLRTDHRAYADGTRRIRLTFENHKTFAPGRHDLTYSATLSVQGQAPRQWRDVRHYRGSNWSVVVEAAPSWIIQQDPAYLAAAQAVLPYDLGYGIASGRVQADLATLGGQAGPLAPGLLVPYFPTTGGRGEIGPLPAWDVRYLKSQDPGARDVMLAMADTAGAVPWHFAEDDTGLPVRVDQRPLFWADESGADEWRGTDRIPPGYFEGSDGGWFLDTSHKPLLTYTAYLVTGDAYYARELAHEAAFAVAKIWPDLRKDSAGVGEELQLRGRAWALRDVSAAAWLLPESDPLKRYFRDLRAMSLAHMKRKYLDEGFLDRAGETEGWFEDTSYSVKGGVPPWQNDYMTVILAQEALRGSADAAALVRWTEDYQAGRFLATGADATFGAAYVHMLNYPGTQDPVGSWREAVALTSTEPAYLNNFPDYGAGYVTSAYAALGMIYRVTGSTRCLQAIGALAATQRDSGLFDPENRTSIHVLPQFLLSYPGTEGAPDRP